MKRRSGFTLLEVILAVAIFAMALVVLSSAFTNTLVALGTIHREADTEPQFRFARSLIITVPNLEDFQEGATLPMPDGSQLTWTAEVQPATVVDLFHVFLHMSLEPADGGEPVLRDESLYLIRPTWSDPIDRSNRINDAKQDLDDRIREARLQ